MRAKELVVSVAVLLSLVACAASAQQSETPPSAVSAKEPLSKANVQITIAYYYVPKGFISEETELAIKEDILLAGNPASIIYFHGKANREFITVSQKVFLPKDIDVNTPIKSGFRWPPRTIPEDPYIFYAFWTGSVHILTYKGERAIVAKNTGHFFVGEEQNNLFWFLFEQLGDDRAIIIDSESYEEWWGPENRKRWAVGPTPHSTQVIWGTPTLAPLPLGTRNP